MGHEKVFTDFTYSGKRTSSCFCGTKNFFRRNVTEYETWIHYIAIQNKMDGALNGWNQARAVKSNQRSKRRLDRFETLYFGMHSYLLSWQRKSQQNGQKWKRKSLLLNSLVRKAKLASNYFPLTFSSDLAPTHYWLFPEPKRLLQGKGFRSDEVIAATKAFFKKKDIILSQRLRNVKEALDWLYYSWMNYVTE